MKRILCFGDSNTWGFVANSDRDRFPITIRYPRVLSSLLGDEYEVIEEGLPGRTMMIDDYVDDVGNRNGSLEFGQIVYSHLPLDYILIMLGTNDLKDPIKDKAKMCASALESIYLHMLNVRLGGRMKNNPKVIIVVPPILGNNGNMLVEAIEESKKFYHEYEVVAKRHNCLLVDNIGLITDVDDIHLSKDSHILLANKIYKAIKEHEGSN